MTDDLRIDVAPLTASAPALRESAWSQLDGQSAAWGRQQRAHSIAFAVVAAEKQFVHSVWSNDVLLGLCSSSVMRRATGEEYLTALLFRCAEPSRRREMIRKLVDGCIEHTRALGLSRLVLTRCPARDEDINIATAALGFRTIETPPDFHIKLDAPMSVASYIERLPRADRQAFRRDLRRAAEAGAVLCTELPPTTKSLDAAWQLVAAVRERKHAEFNFEGRSLFTELVKWLVPGDFGIHACYVDDEMVGCVSFERSNAHTNCRYVGHRTDFDWKVYMALLASSVAQEVERGATSIDLGPTNKVQKLRLGAVAVPHVTHSLRV